ncbi:toll/interleukin-1 receptor domain-containing protein [Protofrankia symbiont of Coriaria ruscifolia]|uniref:toll/interleukin-1 receptor domain-containing protein n=1 Tax=Protofrankia symbiont of Coriaria ruscifolia TaxID=1306542 RepID=UPI0010411128
MRASERPWSGRSVASRGSLKIFYSYAHEDEPILAKLHKHLAPLRHEQIVADWYDRELLPGAGWDSEISSRLESADIVIALLSADFVASEYAYGRELRRALELHDRDSLALVPVVVRPCRWEHLPVACLQVLPEDTKPITSWGEPDRAYLGPLPIRTCPLCRRASTRRLPPTPRPHVPTVNDALLAHRAHATRRGTPEEPGVSPSGPSYPANITHRDQCRAPHSQLSSPSRWHCTGRASGRAGVNL